MGIGAGAPGSAKGRFLLCFFGSTLFWTWDYARFITYYASRASGAPLQPSFLCFCLCQLFVVLTVALLCLLYRRERRGIPGWTMVPGALVLSLYSFVTLLQGFSVDVGGVLSVASSVLAGIAIPFVGVAWGARQTLERGRLMGMVAGSLFLAHILSLVLVVLPMTASSAAISVLPLLSAALWLEDARLRSAGCPLGRFGTGEMSDGDRVLPRLSWWPVAGFFCTCAVCESAAMTLLVPGAGFDAGMMALSMVPEAGVCVMVATLSSRRRRLPSMCSAYAASVLLAVATCACTGVLGLWGPDFLEHLLHGTSLVFDVVLWAYLAHETDVHGISPLYTFGIGMAVSALLTGSAQVMSAWAIIHLGDRQAAGNMWGIALIACLVVIPNILLVLPHRASPRTQPEGAGSVGECTPGMPDVRLEEAWESAMREKRVRFCDAHDLSSRESEVLECLLKGLTAPSSGERLGVTTGTVKTHTYHIYRKLGVNSRQQVVDLFEAFKG